MFVDETNMTQLHNPTTTHKIWVDIPLGTDKSNYRLNGRLDRRFPIVVYGPCTDTELSIWKKLRNIGCPLPWFSSSWSLQEDKVLVFEAITELVAPFDPPIVFRHILLQLSFLHQFQVHGNITRTSICQNVHGYYLNPIKPETLSLTTAIRRYDILDTIRCLYDATQAVPLLMYFEMIKDEELTPNNYMNYMNLFENMKKIFENTKKLS